MALISVAFAHPSAVWMGFWPSCWRRMRVALSSRRSFFVCLHEMVSRFAVQQNGTDAHQTSRRSAATHSSTGWQRGTRTLSTSSFPIQCSRGIPVSPELTVKLRLERRPRCPRPHALQLDGNRAAKADLPADNAGHEKSHVRAHLLKTVFIFLHSQRQGFYHTWGENLLELVHKGQ
jgi:hypothetical protein